MKTIQKRADELKPGDVVIGFGYDKPGVFVGFHDRDAKDVCARFVIDGTDNIKREWMPFGRIVDVRGAALTPAQEHAEELLHWTRLMFDFIDSPATAFYNEYRDGVRTLLSKIDPPKAPTYEEALAALAQLLSATPSHAEAAIDNGRAILDRARRAQVLHD